MPDDLSTGESPIAETPIERGPVEEVAPDLYVSVTYRLYDAQGELADEIVEPITFLHGYAQVVPALEEGLVGARLGETLRVEAEPDHAFGERDEEAVLEIDRHDFPGGDRVKPGDELVATSPEGDEVVHRVARVDDDWVIVDLNHPLAGQAVTFEVTVHALRAATDDELDAAQAVVDELLVGAGAIGYASQPGAEPEASHPSPGQGLVQLRNPCRASDEEKP